MRPVPAVSRAIAILRLLGRNPEPLGVKAIAQSLGMVTSTCLHILRVLVVEELVKVDATKRYSLGSGMLSLARSVIEGNRFPAVVQPVLDRIATEWGVTAIGVEINGLEHMVVVALSRSQVPFRLHVDVGSRFPALISATGRLVAAFGDQPWSEIERRFRALRWQKAPDIGVWRKEIEGVRRKGYSIDRGNYIRGVSVLAVPRAQRPEPGDARAGRRGSRGPADQLPWRRARQGDARRSRPAGGAAVCEGMSMTRSDPPRDPALDGWKPRSLDGFFGLLGPLWTRKEQGAWAYAFLPEAKHTNPAGIVHGGMLTTLLDHTVSVVAWESVERRPCVTVQLDVQFVAAVHPGQLVEARARVVKRTASLVFVQGGLTVAGDEVATASAILKVK